MSDVPNVSDTGHTITFHGPKRHQNAFQVMLLRHTPDATRLGWGIIQTIPPDEHCFVASHFLVLLDTAQTCSELSTKVRTCLCKPDVKERNLSGIRNLSEKKFSEAQSQSFYLLIQHICPIGQDGLQDLIQNLIPSLIEH